MARWLRYLLERSPPLALLLIAGGPALSGRWMAGGAPRPVTAVVAAVAGIVLFLLLARLMDEIKDHDKDRVAHPQRPLARGLIGLAEARRVAGFLFLLGLGLGGAIAVLLDPVAGVLLVVAGLYQWLNHRRVAMLAGSPALDAVVHQLVLLPLYGFALAAASPATLLTRAGAGYLIAALGASLAYEFGRKLDPAAPPLLGGYGTSYGPRACAGIVTACLALAALGAGLLGAGALLWPLELVVLATLPAYLHRPARHRVVEAAAALASLVHLWAIPLLLAWKRFT
jgi:4-hydroxybenzoate polyprenyltransferase